MCCEINIAKSISLIIGVNVQEWFISRTVPNNKPYVLTYFRYSSKYGFVQNFLLTSLYRVPSNWTQRTEENKSQCIETLSSDLVISGMRVLLSSPTHHQKPSNGE